MKPTTSGKTSASMLAILSAKNIRRAMRFAGVLGVGDRDDIGDQPERSHALGSLTPVGGEVRWLAGAVENQIPDNPRVTQSDRQPLAGDRIVVPAASPTRTTPSAKGVSVHVSSPG